MLTTIRPLVVLVVALLTLSAGAAATAATSARPVASLSPAEIESQLAAAIQDLDRRLAKLDDESERDRLHDRWLFLKRQAEDLAAPQADRLGRKLDALRPLLRGHSAPATTTAGARPLAAGSACASAPPLPEGLHRGRISADEELWLKFVPPQDGRWVLDTRGSDFDTRIAIFHRCPEAGGSVLVEADDDVRLWARATFEATSDRPLWIRVSGSDGAHGSLRLQLLGGLPEIRGRITRDDSGEPVVTGVAVFSENGFLLADTVTGSDGFYSLFPGAIGTFFVGTLDGPPELLHETYPDLPCPGGAFNTCDVTLGTPVEAGLGDVIEGIDIALGVGGIVRGKVRNANDDAPIQGARAFLYDDAGRFLSSQETDAVGRFLFRGLARGDHYAVARPDFFEPTFEPELYQELPCPVDCDPTTGTAFGVDLGITTDGIDFTLEPLGTITGQLVDSDGLPILFREVAFRRDSGGGTTFTTTDGAGHYRSPGLTAGSYFVYTDVFGDYQDEIYDDIPCTATSCDFTSGDPVVVTNNSTTSGIDFELERLGEISGTVTAAGSGAAFDFASVNLYSSTGSFVDRDFPNGLGQFTFTDVEAGSYFVAAFAAGHQAEVFEDIPCPSGCDVTAGTPIAVSAGVSVAGIDFELEPFGRVTGRVTSVDTGEAIPQARVRLFEPDGSAAQSVFSDDDGNFDSGPMPPGSYFVRAESSFHLREIYPEMTCPSRFDPCDPTTGDAVVVPLGTTVGGIDFTLQPLGEITGVVTSEDDGEPIAGATVTAYGSDGIAYLSVVTDASGTFRIRNLFSGTFYFVAQASRFVGELYDEIACPKNACDPTSGTSVTNTPGSLATGIDFTLTPRGEIRGTVQSEQTDQPLSGTSISLYNSALEFIASTTSNQAGEFQFFVPTGSYVLQAVHPQHIAEIFDDVPCAPICDLSQGTLVGAINGVVTTGVDFGLEPRIGIFGHVRNATTGAPVNGVTLDLWNEAGDLLASTATDHLGRYGFRLFAGRYHLSTDNDQNAVDEVYDDVQCPLGPAFEGLCDPTAGSLLELSDALPRLLDIDFELTIPEIFTDGFESGDTTSWTTTVP